MPMDISTASTANLLLNKTTPSLQPTIPASSAAAAATATAGSNGYLKRHSHQQSPLPPAVPVSYKECLKNHAATSGGHAIDGCGEFMPSPSSSLNCAACGCHRNFHRREPDDLLQPSPISVQHVIEYQSHHRHHPPPPPALGGGGGGHSSPDSSSPPPISSSYYPSAPHMLLALSSGSAALAARAPEFSIRGRKRFRTKFRQDQKERMQEFAEKVGWKMQKRDEEMISEFCSNVGVEKNVLKVWMHNNKNNSSNNSSSGGGKKLENEAGIDMDDHHYHNDPQLIVMTDHAAINNHNHNNGSSSSS